MKRRIKSIKGFFGQLIHYENGVRVGESWPGLFKDSYDHYDANGRYTGYSDPGMIADMVHHDAHGSYVGETHTGLFGQKNHYSVDHGYTGETWDTLVGESTDLFDNSIDPFSDE